VTTVLYCLGLVFIAATVLPLSRHEAWWIRACDFPRLQISAGLVLVLGMLVAFGDLGDPADQLLALALLACLAYQLSLILPYTPLWPVELLDARTPPGERLLSLMVVNVLMTNRQTDRLFGMIRTHAPDLVLAVEIDGWWAGRFEQLADGYPCRIVHPLDNTYGMLLYAKLELIAPEVRFLLKADVPSIRTGVRLRSGETVTLHGVHPEPPAPGEADTSRPRDAELVLVGREVAQSGRTSIVAGDLNDVAWSHTTRLFRRLSRLLDPRIGRGMFNTFHARYWPLRWPLDHVFASDDFLLESMRRLPAFGSDHFPILIRLVYAPKAAVLQEAPEDDVEDHAEAARKLEQVGIKARSRRATCWARTSLMPRCRGSGPTSTTSPCRSRGCPSAPRARSSAMSAPERDSCSISAAVAGWWA
jgi:endonuclease/exonuclease/phosphatase (EEP) superfamily protein YafD